MSSVEISGKVDIVRQDVMDALDAQPGTQLRSRVGLVLCTVAIVVVVQSTPPGESLPWLVIGLLVLAPIAARFGKGVVATKLHNSLPQAERQQRFELDDTQLVVHSDASRSAVPWGQMTRWREGPRSFLVYTSARHFLILPKRAFDKGDIVSIRELLQRQSS